MATQLLFSEKQANAILEMRLYKLIGLEINALLKEHEETMANIYRYEDILASHSSMTQVLIQELDQIKKAFSTKRKTEITNAEEAVYVEKKMEEMDVYFLMDRFGYVRCIDGATYERNKETAIAENRYVFLCKNTGKVCVFTGQGQMHTIKISDVPFGKFRDKGIPVDNISNFQSDRENIIFACSQSDVNLYRMIFVTKQSMCKIVDGGEFDVAKRTVASTKLLEDDELVSVSMLIDKRNVIMQTKDGYFLRFPIEEIPEKKKGAVGVRGMKLGSGDYVENVYFTQNAIECTIEYKEKQLELNKIKPGKRDSKGTKLRV